MKKEIAKHDIFEIESQPAKVDFLSNHKVVNDYVQKLLSLSNRKGDQRKMKIAISNYNHGVTDILQKILGNMDFNYIINNKINEGNIHQKKHRNDKTFTKFYRKDISFSKENKCDMLICPSKNGTELNLFVFNGRQVFYLDANEITLMFLNFFLIEVNISTKKLPNSYIGTDISPIQSIKNLIKKYDLELSVSEDIVVHNDKFLLFY
jgi:phosphomannomutase